MAFVAAICAIESHQKNRLASWRIMTVILRNTRWDSSCRSHSSCAKATEDSVKLQKTLKSQWVNLENWSIEVESPPFGKRIVIKLLFGVINATDMPLTLKHVEIFVGGGTKVTSPNKQLAPMPLFS